MIGAILKNGASPIITKVATAILGIFLVVIAIMGWKLYVSQERITTLTEANATLLSNVETLKANVAAQDEMIEDLNDEIISQKKRFEDLLESYRNLEEKQKLDAAKAERFRKTLRALEEDLQSEQGKLLNTVIPDDVIDLYNSGNRRLRDTTETSGSR